MSITYEGSARVGIGQYWMMFAGSLIVSVVAIAVAIFSFFSANYFLVLIAVLAMFASGIYLRVAEMRRCRDIGWPAQLPWAFFGILILLALVSFQGGMVSLASSGMSIMVSLADLGFAILVGCIPSKEWQAPNAADYRNHHSETAYAPESGDDDDRDARYDDAVARAVAAYKKETAQSPRASAAETSSARPPARITGFGRKGAGGQPA
jgi:uncharacterized membrane protein YhaH (DUF805 family)